MPRKRLSSVARIGRSYPRPVPGIRSVQVRRVPRRYRVIAGLIGVLSALGLIGWLLAR